MPTVYLTQHPHKRDELTGALVPVYSLTPAMAHGEVIVLMPPQAAFTNTDGLMDQLDLKLAKYDYKNGDTLLTAKDPVIAACAVAILARRGPFTVLRWDKIKRAYLAVRIGWTPAAVRDEQRDFFPSRR